MPSSQFAVSCFCPVSYDTYVAKGKEIYKRIISSTIISTESSRLSDYEYHSHQRQISLSIYKWTSSSLSLHLFFSFNNTQHPPHHRLLLLGT